MTSTKPVDEDALGWSSQEPSATSAATTATPSAEQATVLDRGKTILIADDDPVVVHALARRLQHLGFQVLRSPDAVHALMGAMKTRPDLAVLDIAMPSGNGMAVCEMMASDPRCSGIPVIIHTVSGDEATKERARRMGAYHVEKSANSWREIKTIVETLFGEMTEPEPSQATLEEPSERPPRVESAAEAEPPPSAAETRAEEVEAQPAEESAPSEGEPVAAEQTPVEPPHAQPSEPPLSTPPMCGSAHIVCIENPKDRLEFIDHQLSAIGMDVTRTSDFEEGFWNCFTDKPHVVIIQSASDRAGLLRILRRLAEHPVTRSLPVVLIDEGDLADSGELPSSPTLTVLRHPVEWKDLLGSLEGLLPVLDRDALDPLTHRPAGAAQPMGETGRHPTPTVLCIDDDPVVTRSIAIRLQPYAVKLLAANNGTKGYLMAVKERPDLILLDLKMPNGEGAYILSKLKENDATTDIPVIILTIETHQGIRRKMISAGAAAFLSKPVRWPQLFEEMSHCIELPEQLLHDYKIVEHLTLSQI